MWRTPAVLALAASLTGVAAADAPGGTNSSRPAEKFTLVSPDIAPGKTIPVAPKNWRCRPQSCRSTPKRYRPPVTNVKASQAFTPRLPTRCLHPGEWFRADRLFRQPGEL